jgi:hypothetical protein
MGYAQIIAGQDFVKLINWPCWFVDADLISKRTQDGQDLFEADKLIFRWKNGYAQILAGQDFVK